MTTTRGSSVISGRSTPVGLRTASTRVMGAATAVGMRPIPLPIAKTAKEQNRSE